MPSPPIDIYHHSSELLGTLKSYYVREAGMSSPPGTITIPLCSDRCTLSVKEIVFIDGPGSVASH
jgi:hypothetical protein